MVLHAREQGTPVKLRDGPAAVCCLPCRNDAMWTNRHMALDDSGDHQSFCDAIALVVRRRSGDKAVSQKTYLRQDNFVPSWIGVVIAIDVTRTICRARSVASSVMRSLANDPLELI